MIISSKKIIWIYWAQGWDQAPVLAIKCLYSWIKNNPDWLVLPIDWNSLGNFLDLSKDIPNITKKDIDPTAMSDIVRVALLKYYGGIWADSTVLCLRPISNSILRYSEKSNFFAFRMYRQDREISSWFLYAIPDTYLINEFYDSVKLYWKNRHKKHTYFWVHYLFNNLVRQNQNAKSFWQLTTHKTSALDSKDGPHALTPYETVLYQNLTQEIKDYIDNGYNENFCLKLTRRTGLDEAMKNTKSTLYYLLQKENILDVDHSVLS